MYTALAIMTGAMLLGRIFRDFLPLRLIRRLTGLAILLLLFLLGLAIGHNREILENLGVIGLNSLLLMFFCVGGSIAASVLVSPLLRRYFLTDDKRNK